MIGMIVRLAIRSLSVRPIRTAVLACGFGLGVAVMAELLGIGEVILDQARAPALQGGGDIVLSGAFGEIENARFVMSTLQSSPALQSRIVTASPSRKASLYLIGRGAATAVTVKGGVPSLEKAVGDSEVRDAAAWVDVRSDSRWTDLDPPTILRSLDRFHRQPNAPEFNASWAEWLYFNGRSQDGRVRFYVTFMVGPLRANGTHAAGVRLQLDRDGRQTNYSSSGEVDDRTLLERAPDLDIGASRVRLEGSRYVLTLRLQAEGRRSQLTGQLTFDVATRRSLPPMVVHGARGWLSGYVVPALAARVDGSVYADSESFTLRDASGYHDHNWGFWRDVRWQWGQVAGDEVSLVYGRVFPPASVADPEQMPGFLGVFGRDGVIGVATNVTISERDAARRSDGASNGRPDGRPDQIDVRARGRALDLSMTFLVDRDVRSALGLTRSDVDFLQLGGTYQVRGHVDGRPLDFTARGAAETFRPR